MTLKRPNPDAESISESMARLLEAAFQLSASDIHLKIGARPMYRVQGDLRPVDLPLVEAEELEALASVLSGREISELRRKSPTEFSCGWSDSGRFRGQFYLTGGQPALALRSIPLTIPSMQDLRLPPVVRRFCSEDRGLILVTGATGTGKSTTIASMLSEIASARCVHITTIEDPIEFLIPDGSGCVTQCEVGRDVGTFEIGLVSALRQDPDVLMIGEVRERQTMEVALRAAISGHLVIAAAHFSDTVSAVSGLVGMAEPAEQASCRHTLSEALRGVISQRLLPRRDGSGRVLATEVLVNDPSVRSCIQDESKARGMHAVIARAKADNGGHTLDQSLLSMLRAKLITLDSAQSAALRPAELVREVNLRRIPV